MDVADRLFLQSLLKTQLVLVVGEGPDFVDPGYLVDQVPAQHVLSAGKSWFARGAAGERAG
jgi:hypothetical protein